jgi:hypothetical protein
MAALSTLRSYRGQDVSLPPRQGSWRRVLDSVRQLYGKTVGGYWNESIMPGEVDQLAKRAMGLPMMCSTS